MIIFFLSWIILVAIKVPIAFSLFLVSITYLLLSGHDLYIVVQRMVASIDSFPLLAVPFFIFAGNIMNSTGITRRIFSFAKSLIGRIYGGLGHVNILASVIFAGMSGAAIADAAGLGVMEIEAMLEENYDPGFSAAITAASSTIGPIIPPSIPMVIFAVLSGTSVGKLFAGGFVPGFLMAAGMMIITYFIGRKKNYRCKQKFSLHQVVHTFKEAFFAIITPIIILGGILSGVFTPTEAAVITAAYALLVSTLLYRSLKMKDLIKSILETIDFTANIILIIAAANLFGWILTKNNYNQYISQVLLSFSSDSTILLLTISAIVLVLGCFMEGNSIMLILVPILIPITNEAGIDPVHLGVVFVLSQMIGLITPPFAIILNITSSIAGCDFDDTVRAVIPFLVVLVCVVIIISVFPGMVMLFPNIIFP